MADQNITALTVAAAPASGDQLLLVTPTEEKLIDYNKLADAILARKMISGKTYSSMDDIPTQTQGIYVLSEAIRPDSAASIYMGFCYGNDTSKVVMLVRPDTRAIHINAWLKATGWKGWKSYS